MLTVDELIAVIKLEESLGGPMRSDDCPTVMRMGGRVHPHDVPHVSPDPVPPPKETPDGDST